MNWTIAVPEIVLACIGMAILVFGVLRKQDCTLLCTMFTIGGFLVAALLVLTRVPGLRLSTASSSPTRSAPSTRY